MPWGLNVFLRPLLYRFRGTETSSQSTEEKKKKPISGKHHSPKLKYHTACDSAHCVLLFYVERVCLLTAYVESITVTV